MAQTYTPTAWTYAEIMKSEKQEDGSLIIYGRPTKEEVDVDGQIADKQWIKEALPEWYKWGNIREMHGPSAVGTGQKLEFDENDDPFIQARIIDPMAIKKIEEGVYKGLSIGIKDPIVKRDLEAPNGRIVGGKVVEISVVDRPAVDSAKFDLVKMAGANAWLDCQTGFIIEKTAKPLDGDEVNPADFDDDGNPIQQPGHLKNDGDEPTIISQDATSVVVKVGDEVYRVPIDTDGQGNVVVGEPEQVPGTEPADGEATPEEEEQKFGVSSGMQPPGLGSNADTKEKKKVSTSNTKAATMSDSGLSFEQLQHLALERMDAEHPDDDHWHNVVATYPDKVIVGCGWDAGAQLYAVPVTYPDTADGDGDADDVVLGDPIPVEMTFIPQKHPFDEKTVQALLIKAANILGKAVWSTEYIDDLPDSSFAYIEPGGKKDDEGKTTPRSLRHLPYKDKDGKVDAAHVHNALARLDQTDISDEAKAEAKRKLEAAAKEVGIEVDEKNKNASTEGEKTSQDMAIKAAIDAAMSRKVLCQQCRKGVTIVKGAMATELAGGTRVSGIADCGHQVSAFVKSAETSKKDDKDDNKPTADNEKSEKGTEADGEKGAHPADCTCEKCSEMKDSEPDKKTEDKGADSTTESDDDKVVKTVLAVLKKFGVVKDEPVVHESKHTKLIEDLRTAHAAMAESLDKAASAFVGKDANGGPSRVSGVDPQEVIAELKEQVTSMMRLLNQGEDEMNHAEGATEPNLGENPVAPTSKPEGDGQINFTAGDMKSVVADAVKAALSVRSDKTASIDIAKSVGEAVKGVLEPVINRLEKVEHMSQPSPFIYEADRAYALNPEMEQRQSAVKNVQAEMRKLSPKDQQRVMAAAIAKARGWS